MRVCQFRHSRTTTYNGLPLGSWRPFLLVRLVGFEPTTFGFEVHCSIQLSHRRFTAKNGANDEA